MANFSPPYPATKSSFVVCAGIGNVLAYGFNGFESFLFQQVG
jgi:hypothetical protein